MSERFELKGKRLDRAAYALGRSMRVVAGSSPEVLIVKALADKVGAGRPSQITVEAMEAAQRLGLPIRMRDNRNVSRNRR